MTSFTFEINAARVVFGAGRLAHIAVELDRLGARRALLVSTPGRSSLSESVRALLGDRVVGSFDRAVPHVPEETARSAQQAAENSTADCVVALGGSSAIGVAKAIALSFPVPIAAVPTTYGGSEMTPIWGLTRDGLKETGRSSRVQPKTVIYDPDLTLTLSARTTASSGLNAVAHCVEALYAPDANNLTSLAAQEGMRLLCAALPLLHASPEDRKQRAEAMRGAWLAGFALGTVQMSLHHKLCHTLGGSFDLPHAEAHAVLLPYSAAYNRQAAPQAMHQAAAALQVEDAPTELLSLAREIDAPASLRELGMKEDDLDRAAELAVETPYSNPRAVTLDGIRELLRAAWNGDGGYVTIAG